MTNEQLTFLHDQIEQRIKGIDSRRLRYRNAAFRIFMSTAILAALSTILLGLNVQNEWSEFVRITTLVITCVITIINGYNAFFNHRELWIANNDALNRFYALRFRIEFREKEGTPLTATEIESFRAEYQAILNELNQVWQRTRSDNFGSKPGA
ncbi:DUF4231 domain-containing protein [Chitinophaga sp. SYP-B3965]|uniref:SLATT domain-containing protein n=1 Tax=Chitinophaga sp. SYP-B3965 TaxID=2663120 RepID=UPI0012996465|nr:DUF4231 domain-containing protein [Chitinophaga sp. SYP-B3965]MRG43910.1 DUF4231 domain-containing protein [Chitinophaga sp. SYP-B3965]